MGNSDLAKTISGTGSPVLELLVGASYRRSDAPGVYTVVQFESADEALVREQGSKAVHKISVSVLKPLVESDNARDMALGAANDDATAAAEARLSDIQPLLQYRRIPKAALAERAKETGKSSKTLLKWLRRYRKDPRLSTLGRKKRTDIGGSRFDPLVEEHLGSAVAALLGDGNLTLKDAHGDLVERIQALGKRLNREDLKAPSYGTFYSRYLQISEKAKAEARLGKRPARLLHGISKGRIQDADHPLAIVQVDHLELPVELVDEEYRVPIGKGWITVLIDLFSRCVVGFYITLESPGNLSLGLGVLHAVLPKDDDLKELGFDAKWPIHGLMWTIHADNAGEFHGNMLERAAKEYQIDLMFRKVREPNYGGHIESYLGTLSERLRRLPGATREGPHALGETNPKAKAAMTLKELEKYVRILIIEYHNRPHSGIDKATPLARFMAGMRGEAGAIPIGKLRQPMDPEKLTIDFLPIDERCVQPAGIVWDYIWYTDDCLQRWVNARDPNNISEKRKFLVHRDPRDLSKIYFWDPELNGYRVIGTRDLSRPSITIWELKANKKFLEARGAKDVDEDMIFSAGEERKRIREQAVAKTAFAKGKRAREQERERHAKKKPAAHSSPSLPSSTQAEVGPLSGAPGTAYSMDWGDA